MLSALLGALRVVQQGGAKDTSSSEHNTSCSSNISHQAHSPDLTSHKLLGPADEYSCAKQQFLDTQGKDGGYGYGPAPQPSRAADCQQQAGPAAPCLLDHVREEELRRLHGLAYLDHAGAALYSERQLDDVFTELKTQLLTNPHSAHGAGSPAADAEAELRRLTLDMLHAPAQDYEVILTAGATAAIKLVGDCFPWTPASTLTYTLHNHNSVLGLREHALSAGAAVHVVDLEQPSAPQPPAACPPGQPLPPPPQHLGPYAVKTCAVLQRTSTAATAPSEEAGASAREAAASSQLPGASGPSVGPGVGEGAGGGPAQPPAEPCHLLALPLECNFSGLRYSLDVTTAAQAGGLVRTPCEGRGRGRCLVLVDAAKGCSTAPPNLSTHPVDFLALSYYKIFGYPTGLGALVVRKDALPLLTKTYFAGGTVLVSVADQDFMQRRTGHSGLEYGTLPFTSTAAARHGFRFLQLLGGFPAIGRHAGGLAAYLAHSLRQLRYGNGRPAAEIYGWDGAWGPGLQGPTVTFNLLRPDGSYVGYGEVRQLATLHGLHLRCGCFCNPGACAKMLSLTGADLRAHFQAGHVCWDDQDLVDGRPTGAVRASLGALSSFEEVYLLIRLIRHYWVLPGASAPGLLSTSDAAGPEAGGQRPGDQGSEAASRGRVDGPERGPADEPDAVPGTSASSVRPALGDSSSQMQGAAAALPGTEKPPAAPAASATATAADPGGAGGAGQQLQAAAHGTLTSLFLYPVKSCAPQQVSCWPVGPTGLLYDREWALLDDSGRVLTQKSCPRMATLVPSVDLQAGSLSLSSPNCQSQLVVLVTGALGHYMGGAKGRGGPAGEQQEQEQGQQWESIQVCGERVCGVVLGEDQVAVSAAGGAAGAALGRSGEGQSDAHTLPAQRAGEGSWGEGAQPAGSSGGGAGDPVQRWFLQALGLRCRLVRQMQGSRATKRTDTKTPHRQAQAAVGPGPGAAEGGEGVTDSAAAAAKGSRGRGGDAEEAAAAPQHVGFANDGQYLLVNTASIADLNARLAASGSASGPRLKAAQERNFRPNLVVEGFAAYAEDLWIEVQVGRVALETLGTCPRCEMLQVDQESGTRGGADILLELAQYRRRGGKMHFGMLLAASSSSPPAEASHTPALPPQEPQQDPGDAGPRSRGPDQGLGEGDGTGQCGEAGAGDKAGWMQATFAAVMVVGMPVRVIRQSGS